MSRRLVVVYSRSSSQYAAVEREVLKPLREVDDIEVVEHDVSGQDFDENVKQMVEVLCDGDVVLVASGDGTATATANAVLKSGREVAYAALPYGNFNDLARTLKISGFDEIFKEILRFVKNDEKTSKNDAKNAQKAVKSAKKSENLAKNDEKVQNLRKWYPLEVWVDGEFWRYAPCYVTIGMTAEACEIFDDKKVRKAMRAGHRKVRPYIYMVKWYFKNRRVKRFLPNFSVNGVERPRGTSDYAAVNGPHMARVMKSGGDYLKPEVFRSMTERLTGLPRLTWLMLRAMTVRTPGVETRGDVLKFDGDGEVEVQAEGEYERFKNPREIRIFKSKKYLRVIEGSF